MVSGFSLVEVAVVLVVIALILGAVIQGRALIDNARYKSFRQTVHAQRDAFHTFRERYHALPGDFGKAQQRLGSGQTNGSDPNGLIKGSERYNAWRHLRAAGLLKGDPNPNQNGADIPPTNAYGGQGSLFFSGKGEQDEFGPKLLVKDIPVEIAQRLDTDEDDGHCNSGRVTGTNCTSKNWSGPGPVDVVYGL